MFLEFGRTSAGEKSARSIRTRTPTGSGHFAFLGSGFEHNFGQIVCIRVETLNNTNLVAGQSI